MSVYLSVHLKPKISVTVEPIGLFSLETSCWFCLDQGYFLGRYEFLTLIKRKNLSSPKFNLEVKTNKGVGKNHASMKVGRVGGFTITSWVEASIGYKGRNH